MPAEYREVKYSEPTAIYYFLENQSNLNVLGLRTSKKYPLTTDYNVWSTLNKSYVDDALLQFSTKSYTNLELLNLDSQIEESCEDDFSDFAIQPIAVREYVIKVKAFKINKSIPLII